MTNEELIEQWGRRSYSWSQHSSFAYDPDQWFHSYILNERGDGSAAMKFGNTVGISINTDTPLANVPRQVHMEFEVRAKIGNIDLVGFFDSYSCGGKKCCPPGEYRLEEYKTSANPTRWTQKSVDEHGQLAFYAMLLYLKHKVKPEDIKMNLHWIPVAEDSFFEMYVSGKHVTFPTKRTMKDIFKLMVEIKVRRKEMLAYARKRLAEL